MPILAVSLSADKIDPFLKEARKAGVLLWNRNDLHKLRQWVESQSADEIYKTIEGEFASMQVIAAHESGLV